MKRIVLGLVFILFNFNLTLGNVIINLIPSFIGYYFIMNACVILAEKTQNEHYLETRKMALLLFVINLFTFVLDLIGLSSVNPYFSAAIGILNLILSLVFLSRLTQSITTTTPFDLDEAWITKLRSLFKWIVVLDILGFVLLIVPMIALMVLVVAMVFHVLYIIQINQLNQRLDPEYL